MGDGLTDRALTFPWPARAFPRLLRASAKFGLRRKASLEAQSLAVMACCLADPSFVRESVPQVVVCARVFAGHVERVSPERDVVVPILNLGPCGDGARRNHKSRGASASSGPFSRTGRSQTDRCFRSASDTRPNGHTSISRSTKGSVTSIGFAISPNAKHTTSTGRPGRTIRGSCSAGPAHSG